MALRSHWNRYLKLSLVSCPISLYPAISAAERVSFRQVNRQTGNRLRRQLVDAVTGEVVESENKGRGYQIGEHQLLLIEDEELEAARREARTRPYHVAPVAGVSAPQRDTSVEDTAANVPATKPKHRDMKPEEAAALRERPNTTVRLLNNRTIEIERCIPRAQMDARYFDTPYYIAPRDEVGLVRGYP